MAIQRRLEDIGIDDIHGLIDNARERDVPRMSWKLDERSLLGNG